MKPNDNPCYGCKERTPDCHGWCEKYLATRAENDKKIQERIDRNASRDLHLNYLHDRRVRQKRRKHLQ